jgi:predicted DNA-binding transcriptional regulator AlpA
MSLDHERLVKTSELSGYGVPYRPTRIMQLVAAGEFPQPIKLSPRRNVWRASDLQNWIDRIATNAA